METPGGRGLADRLLGLAFSLLAAAVMVVIAVRLLESIWPALLVIIGIVGALGIAGLLIRHWWESRYW